MIELATKKAYFLEDINGEEITDAIWMPDGSVLLATEGNLYRSSLPFETVTTITKMEFEEWGALAVSPDGLQIAFKGGGHLWMMDAQGANLEQITTSAGEEGAPAFSPDGRYLLVGMQQFSSGAGPWGGYYTMYVIPANGKQYRLVDGENSPEVWSVKAKGGKATESYNGRVQWLK